MAELAPEVQNRLLDLACELCSVKNYMYHESSQPEVLARIDKAYKALAKTVKEADA